MTTEIATKQTPSPSDGDFLAVLQNSLYPGASLGSIRMVIGYCKAAGLDPMQKPVHIVPMWDSKSGAMRDVVMPGIGMYRTQAARAGCAGISEPEFGPDVSADIGGQKITHPSWCKVTVRRIVGGTVCEFTAQEYWIENYAIKGGREKSTAPNAMWTKRPYGQLAKCAEAQALRKAFPEIGSSPTAEEMEGKTLDAQTPVDPPEYLDVLRRSELDDLAAYMTDCFNAGEKDTVVQLWYAPDTFHKEAEEANEEKLYMWRVLKKETALRRHIKSHNPNQGYADQSAVSDPTPGPAV